MRRGRYNHHHPPPSFEDLSSHLLPPRPADFLPFLFCLPLYNCTYSIRRCYRYRMQGGYIQIFRRRGGWKRLGFISTRCHQHCSALARSIKLTSPSEIRRTKRPRKLSRRSSASQLVSTFVRYRVFTVYLIIKRLRLIVPLRSSSFSIPLVSL